jgi:NAD(P)-dependent dehydrogenase (short-subunit alcohol dehydrogenase family)
MERLRGRVAIVTGGGRGNGKAICGRFVEEGSSVVVADINTETGQQVAEELSGDGDSVSFEYLDVRNEDDVAAVVDRTVDKFGKLDIIVNNAGIQEDFTNTEDLSIDVWNDVIATNLTGVFLGTKHALRHMKQQGSGVIINVSSGGAGINAFATLPAYSASKAGVTNLTKAIALEVAAQGIRCNCICPGNIDTPLMDRIVEQMDAQGIDGRKFVSDMHPIGRLGNPREVADAAVFLASDESSLITGIPLIIDGGFNAGGNPKLAEAYSNTWAVHGG